MPLFAVRHWSAWAQGLTFQRDWLEWSRQDLPLPTVAEVQTPRLESMPTLTRRRLNLLGRMAAHVAYEARDAAAPDSPVVYASRYGDAGRATTLIADLATGNAISPTSFGLSVHNAIGAVIGIGRSDRGNSTALAAGQSTSLLGLVESLALLADGAAEVTLVHYDEPLPPEYAQFMDEPPAAYAWALNVATPAPGEASFELQTCATGKPVARSTTGLPNGLALLRFLLGAERRWQVGADETTWTVTRHD